VLKNISWVARHFTTIRRNAKQSVCAAAPTRLIREPSRHGKTKKESSPQEEKGCSKEEKEVISTSCRQEPSGALVFYTVKKSLTYPSEGFYSSICASGCCHMSRRKRSFAIYPSVSGSSFDFFFVPRASVQSVIFFFFASDITVITRPTPVL